MQIKLNEIDFVKILEKVKEKGKDFVIDKQFIDKCLLETKPPLLTTYEGDNYYNDEDMVYDVHSFELNTISAINIPFSLCPKLITVKEAKKNKENIYFSSTHGAKKYMELNMKLISYLDIINMALDENSYLGKKDIIVINKKSLLNKLNSYFKGIY